MAQRASAPQDRATVRRTLHWFWWVTRKKPFAAFMAVFTSVTYTALLNYANTYVMGRIVDRVSAEPVPATQVWEVFAPYVIALLVVNAVGQTCSKLQDWSVMQLEMNGNSGFRGNELMAACNVRDDGCHGYVLVSNDAPYYSAVSIICDNGVIREISFECIGSAREADANIFLDEEA